MNTFMEKKETVERKWYVIDAEGVALGRLASKVAVVLKGKHKPTYTPHIDGGDYVIVVNADKIAVTGNKLKDKKYYRHSHYAGGLKQRTAQETLDQYPEKVIEFALKRIHNGLNPLLILFRHKVKDTLKRITLECSILNLFPHIIIDNVEFSEQRTICNLLKPCRIDSIGRILDEILHHLHTIHIGVLLMHKVDIVLP